MQSTEFYNIFEELNNLYENESQKIDPAILAGIVKVTNNFIEQLAGTAIDTAYIKCRGAGYNNFAHPSSVELRDVQIADNELRYSIGFYNYDTGRADIFGDLTIEVLYNSADKTDVNTNGVNINIVDYTDDYGPEGIYQHANIRNIMRLVGMLYRHEVDLETEIYKTVFPEMYEAN